VEIIARTPRDAALKEKIHDDFGRAARRKIYGGV